MPNATATDSRGTAPFAWLLFFLNPLIGLCVSLTDYKSNTAKNVVWAFCVFYGLMFNILPGQGTDCVRYADDLKQMHLTQMSWELLSASFYREGQLRFDIYQPTITLIVSRFTDDYHYLFAIFGITIGYFYSRTLWYFVQRLPERPSLVSFLFIVAAAFILNPGNAINGVRMYTAFYVYVYASLLFLERPRLVTFALASSSVLIHFSFAYPVLLLLAVPIAERLPGFTLGVFTLSFLQPAIENTLIADWLSFLPGFQQRVSFYLSDPLSRDIDIGWLPRISKQGEVAFVLCSAYLLPPLLRKHESNALARISILAILAFTGVNLCWNIYSFGRFSYITVLLFCGLWATIPAKTTILRIPFQLFGIAVLLMLLPEIAISFRMFLGFVSIGLVIGNPLVFLWFYDADKSAYDFLIAKFRPW